jgi:hypothetical protein
MKVETGLKSGALAQDAAAAASQAAGSVQSFFAQAGQQAQGLTNSVVTKASSFWSCLTGR